MGKAKILIKAIIENRAKYEELDDEIKGREDSFNEEMQPLYERRNRLSETIGAISNVQIPCRVSNLIKELENTKRDYNVSINSNHQILGGVIDNEQMRKMYSANQSSRHYLYFNLSHKNRNCDYLDFQFLTCLPAPNDIQPDGKPFIEHIIADVVTSPNGSKYTKLGFDNLDNVLVTLPLNTAKHWGIMEAIANAEYDPQENESEKE